MRELDLDVAGEFLVMAATLLHIKSRTLVPRLEVEFDDEEEGDIVDPTERNDDDDDAPNSESGSGRLR